MKYIIILVLISLKLVSAQHDYQRIHREALVVDMHTDVLLQVLRGADISKKLDVGHVDLVRLKEGAVDVQFFAVWPNPELYKPDRMYQHTAYMIDVLERIIRENQNKIVLTRSPQEIREAVTKGKIAGCIGVEGGTAIENDLNKLRKLYDRGVRYLGLTWNDSHEWASSAQDEVSKKYLGYKGLTAFGYEVIREMNDLGMMIDVSHSGDRTFWDVIKTSTKPIIASHSCTKALRWHYRNLNDNQIKAIGQNGGVIFINFYPGYLDYDFGHKYDKLKKSSAVYLDSMKKVYGDDHLGYRKFRSEYYKENTISFRPKLEIIVDHMDYIIRLIGEDHVGLGSDFDGISITPKGLEDVSDMAQLTRCMLARGYSEKRIQKILGDNFMRVFEQVSNAAK
jgi:membrane dipeptidase